MSPAILATLEYLVPLIARLTERVAIGIVANEGLARDLLAAALYALDTASTPQASFTLADSWMAERAKRREVRDDA